LDFHDKITTIGIFKTRFYISDKVPFSEMLIGTIVVGVLLYIVFIILHRHFKQFWLGLKRHSPHARGVLIAVILNLFIGQCVRGSIVKPCQAYNASQIEPFGMIGKTFNGHEVEKSGS
jgi:hypothetical protein